jgi:hypothetical protein
MAVACASCSKSDNAAVPTVPLADGGTLVVPAQCRPDAGISAEPPFTVNFRLRNVGPTPVFYRGSCVIEFAVGSCAAGFADDLNHLGAGGCSCEFHGNCPVGGPCEPLKGSIDPGEEVIVPWAAIALTRSMVDGVECSRGVNLPAGSYELRLPLYADTSATDPPLRTVRRSFTLPAVESALDVPIAP